MGEKMLNFAWPWMIILLPLPLLIRYSYTVKQAPVILFPKLQPLWSAFGNNAAKFKPKLDWRVLLTATAWFCLVFSLMRPELVKDIAYAKNNGYDLMLAVDLSRSMDIVDFTDHGQPISRIVATKKVVSTFVQQRTGDRIGLIVFAEQAFLTIPLTLDSSTVVKMLNNLLVGMAGENTALGDAIGIAVQNLRKRPLVSRVLILLTDGADNASHIPPLEAAKIAAKDKIKIYTIGVGNNLDDKLLGTIASMTGGTYAKVTNVDALKDVYAQIDKLEKSEATQRALLIRTPIYQYFLCLALFCLIVMFASNHKNYRYHYGN